MVIRANRYWVVPATVVGLGIIAAVSLGDALAAERNLDARSDRATRRSETGVDSTIKQIRRNKAKTDAQKNVVIPKKKGSTDQ